MFVPFHSEVRTVELLEAFVYVFVGLAMTGEGHLVTLNDAFHGDRRCELILFDPHSGDVVKRVPYGPLTNVEQARSSQPRFMDCRDDTLVVSDLGTRNRSRFHVIFAF